MELEKPLTYLVVDSHVKWPGRELVRLFFYSFLGGRKKWRIVILNASMTSAGSARRAAANVFGIVARTG